MNLLIQILILNLSLLTLAEGKSGDDDILWRAGYKLRWEDFKGNPTFSTNYSEKSATKIRIEVTTMITKESYIFSVGCLFEKYNSWTVNDTSESLLNHEQLHFDIGEVFARELRKKISEMNDLTDSIIQDRVKVLYHEINNACIKYEKKYDNETNNGRNLKEQKVWRDRISNILQNSNKYSSLIVTLNKKR